jgi:Methyltransferase domain
MRLLQRASSVVSCYFDLKAFHPVSSDAMVDFCFAHTIKPLQVPEELRTLVAMIARLRPNAVLEIGTCGGGTLWLWCQLATPDASIISVDLPHGHFGGGYHWIRIPLYRSFAQPKQSLHLIRRSSHENATHALVASKLSTKRVQFLFIDGDHSYAGVKQDFEMYRGMVEPGAQNTMPSSVPSCSRPTRTRRVGPLLSFCRAEALAQVHEATLGIRFNGRRCAAVRKATPSVMPHQRAAAPSECKRG